MASPTPTPPAGHAPPGPPPPASAAVARRRWRGRRRVLRWLVGAAPPLLSGALRLLGWTTRVRYVGAQPLLARWAGGERVILALWHNRVVMMPIAYRRHGRGRRLCIMNSQSRDGEIATRALARWRIRSVRGSATRGGVGGFLQLVDAYRRGYDLAVTPDGPLGPCGVVKPGVIHLAQATGAPIFPITYAATCRRRLRSWDRLLIPLPFARVVFHVGAPLQVPRRASPAQLEALRHQLQEQLDSLTAAADREVAGRGGSAEGVA